MIVATLLVIMMAVPGLALFYGGMVRTKKPPWKRNIRRASKRKKSTKLAWTRKRKHTNRKPAVVAKKTRD